MTVAAARMAVEHASVGPAELRDVPGLISIGTTDGDARDVEGFGVAPRGVVERHAREVALDVTGHAIRLILVVFAGPLADQAHLRRGGERRKRE